MVTCLALLLAAVPVVQGSRPVKRPIPRAPVKTGELATLVTAWREAATPARRSALEQYAALHAKDENGALARLALGVGSYEQHDFSAAIAALTKMQPKLPRLADYTAYYLALARVEMKDTNGVVRDLAAAHPADVRSPLAGKAWVVQARALAATDPGEAVRLLREHYSELPQPEGDVTLADSYQAGNQLPLAAEFYQRVYYRYLAGDAANRAAAALLTLKDTMGASYPQPLPEQLLSRADRVLELRDYARARSEYQTLDLPPGLAHDQALVRIGAVDYLSGKAPAANAYLRGLEIGDSEADAERQYYLVECARHVNDDGAMTAAIDRLATRYPKSPWRLKALLSAANRYLLVNRTDDYVPLYRAAYENFPAEPPAGLAHWKVTFQAYLHGKPEAATLLRDHLKNYPGHPTAGAALYFTGRLAEESGDPGSARACYQRLAQSFQNHYYAMLARARLARPELAGAALATSTETEKLLASLNLTDARPVPAEGTRVTALRIERSRMLRTAGLTDLADSELRYGSRTDGQPALLGMEIAQAADTPHQALRIMKGMAPDYLYLTFNQAPRKFWELLFPLPYRSDLTTYARERELDPFLVAGLIRQESEFNPEARSPANAYGLTQVRPVTGRQFARKAGVSQFSNRMLMQPVANLKIGTSILRSMLDHNSGNVEQTLAAYNAGPARVAEWMTWSNYREPAEFVESIPFTETRDYVQAVLRNADIYRRLYQ